MDEKANLTRRDFLKAAGSAGVLAAIAGLPFPLLKQPSAKVIVVGAGIAGLNAAHYLKRGGVSAEVYEASARIGGRIFTVNDALGLGLRTEYGGEFVDSTHTEILTLAKEFELDVDDRKSPAERSLIPRAYFFGGILRSEAEVIEGIKPFLERIRVDANSLPRDFDFTNPGTAGTLDNLSLAEYFHNIGLSGWVKDLLEAAYVSEFGLELADQSALNFITFVSTDISDEFKVFGASDERFLIRGGNAQLTKMLSERLRYEVKKSHRLEAIKSKGRGFTLTFRTEGAVKDIDADIVIMAIPFSILREVDIKMDLPPWKTKAIRELGYGTNTKIMSGFEKKVWREEGFLGEIFSDANFQLAWDNSQMQNLGHGGLTSFTGGKTGLEAGTGTVDFQSDRFVESLEKIFPGISQTRNGRNQRFHWPSYPFAKGSYAAYKPGQWTSVRGAEMKPVGNLFFAGEHCSLEFQGFMNGAAESGKSAAMDVLKLLG